MDHYYRSLPAQAGLGQSGRAVGNNAYLVHYCYRVGLLVFTLWLSVLSAQAQAPSLQWQKALGGTSTDEAYAITAMGDGGLVVAGYTSSTAGDVTGNRGGGDVWVVKLDAQGSLLWQKTLGGTGGEIANAVTATSDGGLVVAGYTESNDGDVTGNQGQTDVWVVKLDAQGNLLWQKTLGGSGRDYANAITALSDGGLVIAGYTNSTDGIVTGNQGGNDVWVVKLDAQGNLQWQKALGGSGDDRANTITATSDGGLVVAGYTNSTNGDVMGNHGGIDIWVVKLDAQGNLQWQKALGGSNSERANAITVTSDGGLMVAGFSSSTNGDVTGTRGGSDVWVVKLDAQGNLLWQKTLGGMSTDDAYGLTATGDGGVVVTGITISTDGDITGNQGGYDYWVVKLDAQSNLLWQKTLGGTSYDESRAVTVTSDGGLVVAGYTQSNDGDVTGNQGRSDYWVVKLLAAPPCGSIVYVTPDGAGLQDGSSWANAFAGTALQTAINTAAGCGAQVWVAQGTYKPTTGEDRTISFAMQNGVAIYGGFVGSETTLTDRNPASYTTVLSGDIGEAGTSADNSYHVINNPPGLTSTAVLDGFVITAGNADGDDDASNRGGGIYNTNSSPSLTNCVFLANTASVQGGGIFNNNNSSPSLTNCSFLSNSASNGGGMYNYTSSPSQLNCIFLNNTANNGGGMYNLSSSPSLLNCSFQANTASDGGGMYNYTSSPRLTNCSFLNNTASSGGGGMNNYISSPSLLNCSFLNNTAGSGGGISSFRNTPSLTNCVVFGNGGANTFRNNGAAPLTARYSLFETSVTGYVSDPTNLTTTTSPFVSATDPQLRPCSPAINAGDNAAYTTANGPATDLAGNPRLFNGEVIDMGAYEYQGDPVTVTVNNPAFSTATVRQAFSQAFTATGGTEPYSFSVLSSDLPASLSLSTAGVLSGTPTQVGSYTLLVQASDVNGCAGVASTTYTVTVSEPVADGPVCDTYTTRTTANGLGNNNVLGVYAEGSAVYVATNGGLSISTDGGTSFTNKTTANGLGTNGVRGVYAVGSVIYAATALGLSISTDGGSSFTTRTIANGLGNNNVFGVYAVSNVVYAATEGGVSISSDGGNTYTTRTTANGLGNNDVFGVYAVGSVVYAATNGGGLSISTDEGNIFTNKTTANGLGSNTVRGVYAEGSVVYAATNNGLSISTDGGSTFTNRTTANGLGNNAVFGVYAVGNVVYAATLNGLSISTDGGNSFTTRTTANGLGNNLVSSVYTAGNRIYAATSGGGLSFCPIPLPPFVLSSFTASPATLFTTGSASLSAVVTGGTGPYSYVFSGPGVITPSGNTASVSGLSAGVQTFTVVATDATAPTNQTVTGTVSVTVSEANTPPTVANAIPPQSATVGQSFSFDIPANTFTDTETLASLTLTVAGLPDGLSFTAPATISGTPSTTVGSPFSVTVTATDPGNLSVSTVFAITVQPAPVVVTPLVMSSFTASPTTLLTTASTSLSAVVTGGTGPYSYIFSGPGAITPSGNSASVSGLSAGVQTFTVTATDATAPTNQTVTGTVSVTVSEANTPPTVANFAASPSAVCVGSPITFTATIGNVTGSYSYTLTNGGSTSVAASSSNTVFSQNLTASGNGPQSFTLTVNNGGPSATATTSLTVNALPTPTLLTPNGQSSLTVDLNADPVTLLVSGCAGTAIWAGPNATSGTGTTITVPTSQPGTFVYQARCVLGTCTSPPASATVTVGGRLTVLHRDVDNYADNNAVQPLLQLQNQGTAALPLSAITLRYYLSPEGTAPLTNLFVFFAQVGSANVTLRYVPLEQPQSGATGYLEYGFTGGAGSLAPGANSGPIQSYAAKSDYGSLNELDDYSYNPVRDQLRASLRITAYYNGVLIAGIEPGTTPSIRALRALTESKNGPSATQISTFLEVRNEGTVPINYSDLKVRYYFTADGNQPLRVELDDAGAASAVAQVVPLSPALTRADTYVELRFANGGQLAPQSSTGLIRYRISRVEGSRFDQTNDHSYQEQPAERSQNSRVVVYVGGERVWGQEPGAGARVGAVSQEWVAPLRVLVLGNPVVGEQVEFQVRGAEGQPLRLSLTNLQGQPVSERVVERAGAVEHQTLRVAGQPAGLLLLRVSTPGQTQTVKVLKR